MFRPQSKSHLLNNKEYWENSSYSGLRTSIGVNAMRAFLGLPNSCQKFQHNCSPTQLNAHEKTVWIAKGRYSSFWQAQGGDYQRPPNLPCIVVKAQMHKATQLSFFHKLFSIHVLQQRKICKFVIPTIHWLMEWQEEEPWGRGISWRRGIDSHQQLEESMYLEVHRRRYTCFHNQGIQVCPVEPNLDS